MVLSKAEAVLHCRPFAHAGVDPTDPEPLIPFHFLTGRAPPRYLQMFSATEIWSLERMTLDPTNGRTLLE